MSNRQIGPVAKELIAAKKRIEDPANWCQGEATKGERMCAMRAAAAWSSPSHEYLNSSAEALFPESSDNAILAPGAWVNDFLGHKAVMQMYSHAIARAISDGK